MATKTKKKGAAAAFAETLAKIDARLAEVNPRAAEAMRPGASPAAIASLAKAVGAKGVRGELEALFRWHDGQSSPVSLREEDNLTPMSVDGAIDAWRFLFDPAQEALQPWRKTWLPIFENGAGDYLCFDLASGALVEYWHADEDRSVRYPSLAAWADDVLRSLDGTGESP